MQKIKFIAAILLFTSSLVLAKEPVTAYSKLPVPKKGGTLYVVSSSNPTTLNPLLDTNMVDRQINSWLFMSLMSIDPDTYELIPGLAEKMEVSKDKKEYTFTLFKDAKWSDGTPVTSDDIVFTFEKLMDPKVEAAPLRGYFSGVTLEKIDAQKVKFKIDAPRFNTRDFIASFTPIQKKEFEHETDFNRSKENLKPTGNTAYKFKSFSRDQSVILERDPNWWASKQPDNRALYNFDTIHFRIIPDPTLSYERLLKGEIDVMEVNTDVYHTQILGVDKDKVGTKANSGKAVWANKFTSDGAFPWFGLAMNYKSPLFTKKTRHAIAYLIDYKAVIDKAFFGLPEKCLTPFGSNTENTDPSLRKKENQYSYDPKKAAALLKEDGWADTDGDNLLDKVIDGKKTKFSFVMKINGGSAPALNSAQILKESFKKAGIELEIRTEELAAYFKDVNDSNFEVIIAGFGGGSIFPDPKQIWHSDSAGGKGSNTVGYSNPKVDKLITKANLEFDRKKRAKLLQEIGKILYDDLPYVFLIEKHYSLEALNSRIQAPRWMFKYSSGVAKEVFHL
ncbi:MAG: hypothetical protein JST80_05100 [Bdellovibrionales bacterium]|nr:hypothetical protein [Bdellovibrionales bacterium]